MSRAEPWTIADVIDLESFLAADAESREEPLRQRDATIGQELRRQSAEIPSRRELLHQWLDARRHATHAVTPGATFSSTAHLAAWIAVLGGFALGCGLCAGLLHYKGIEPVNVSVFFAWTVLLQVLIFAAGLLVWLLRGVTGSLHAFHPLRSALGAVLWAGGVVLRRLPGAQREQLRATIAIMERRRSLYHPLTVWPALALTQAFAVAWNIGILVTLLGHVAATDLAFGWQSTLNASAERVHRLTEVVAAPWSGLIRHAHPTLDQVRASRFIYSEGVKTLDVRAAVSWWPFLACSVAFYGLFLRALFLFFCVLKTRRALAMLPFDHHECNALLRRLTGPLVQDAGEAVALTIPGDGDAREPVVEPGAACLCLYAREMESEWPVTDFAPYLERAYGWRVAASMPAAIDRTKGQEPIITALTDEKSGALAAVALFVSARRSPIVAIALFLKHLQSIAGPRIEFVVILVARDADGQCTSASEETHRHWRNFSAIHHLPIGIETWQPAFVAPSASPPV